MSKKSNSTERGFTMTDSEEPDLASSRDAPDPTGASGVPAGDPIPPIDFSTFVLSLGTSALYHLGLVADPQTGAQPSEPNLVLARQTIDTLEMLAKKTQGNLEPEEAKLIESVLYEMRMRFVEANQ